MLRNCVLMIAPVYVLTAFRVACARASMLRVWVHSPSHTYWCLCALGQLPANHVDNDDRNTCVVAEVLCGRSEEHLTERSVSVRAHDHQRSALLQVDVVVRFCGDDSGCGVVVGSVSAPSSYREAYMLACAECDQRTYGITTHACL